MEENRIFVEAVSVEDEDAKSIVAEYWKESWLEAGYSERSFRDDWKININSFIEEAEAAGLHPRIFVVRNRSGHMLASINCQIWAGPIPWVVQPKTFQLGTVWGMHVSKQIVDPAIQNIIRKELLKAATKHLDSVRCSKVVTLVPTPTERDAMVNANVGFQPGNMLTLDLMNIDAAQHTVKDCSNTKVVSGPAGSEFDALVCSHWQKMWNEVGIPTEALLPDMEALTCSFIDSARRRLNYQTFLARCPLTERVVGSVSCQIWEGPFPKILGTTSFQMGTVWAVYVDPEYRRQGIATTLMKKAMSHLRSVGCHVAVLIAASEAGQNCYERLGFRPNNALVCDIHRDTSTSTTTVDLENDEKKDDNEKSIASPAECSDAGMVLEIQQALADLVSVTKCQANAMRTSTSRQLLSVFGEHPQGTDIITSIFSIQKKHGLFIDPNDNWFTQNANKFGRGFRMKDLRNDPSKLASKFDRLSTHYDHWTVGNRSKVESFIVQRARRNPLLLPPKLQGDELSQSATMVRVLDVACGIGLQGQVLRLAGFQGVLVGTDISSGMIQRVKQRGCYNHAYVANAHEDIKPASQPLEMYDVVICTGAMELLNQASVLTQLSEMTKEGGELWVSFQHKAALESDDNPTGHQDLCGVTQDEAVNLLSRTGFGKVLSVETCSDAFYTPSPAQDGKLLPVPYLFITAQKLP